MEDICFTGGAIGADTLWANAAKKKKHGVIHFTFAGSNLKFNESEVVVLTDEQLSEAILPVNKAARSMGLNPPKSLYPKKLIYRNYYQIRYSDSVYAVTNIEDGCPTGGTRWAIQMMINEDRDCPIYVFDQVTELWHQYDYDTGTWYVVDNIPHPKGKWTGIGSRYITEQGKQAIKDLMS